MEHDEDEAPRDEIVDETSGEHDAEQPDHADESQSAVEPILPDPDVSLEDSSADWSESPGEADDANADPPLPADGPVTRIELPAELDFSSQAAGDVTGDRHSYPLPLEPVEESEGDSNPTAQLFPPAWRLPDSAAQNSPTEPTAAANADKIGDPPPRIQVLVTLVEAKAMYLDAIDKAVEKHGPKFRQIAEYEVERGFRYYESQRRAADWRLRGP